MKIIVKKAERKDIPAIYEITKEAFTKYAKDLGQPNRVDALHETYETIERDMVKKHVLVGFLDGTPVGSIRFEILPGNIAYISRFGVKLDCQKCGMGRALMIAVEDECRKMGVSSLTLHTCSKMTDLMRFYYGLGYYVHSTSTSKGYIRALLCKDLADIYEYEVELGAVMSL